MNETTIFEMPWVTFQLMDQQYAFSSAHVKEMVIMPEVVSLPKASSAVRGVINLRGGVIPLIDLRIKLGMSSLLMDVEDVSKSIKQREQDHIHWLNALEESVQGKSKFELTTDPHQCAFGQWYDHYQTEDRILAACLKKFDQPHKKIHGIANLVLEKEAQGDYDEAMRLIDQTRNSDLLVLQKLFGEFHSMMEDCLKEIAVVLEYQDRRMAVSVDRVETVEKLMVSEIGEMPEIDVMVPDEFLLGIGKRGKGEDLVQLLDIQALFHTMKEYKEAC